MTRFSSAALFVAAVAAIGCHGAPGDDPSSVRVDEAPRSIASPGASVPHFSADIVVEIGTVAGEAPYLLGEVNGVEVLSDGRIVVLDGMSDEIRFFSANGEYLEAVGQTGKGPGEFLTVSSVSVLNDDSLLVFDSGAQRVSLFDAFGRYTDSWRPVEMGTPPFPTVVGATTEGHPVLRAFVGESSQRLGRFIGIEVLGVMDRADSSFVVLDSLSVYEGARVASSGGGAIPAIVPFGAKTHVVVVGDRIVALGPESSIRVYAPDGSMEELTFEAPEAVVGEGDVERWIESFFAQNDFQYPRVEAMWREGFERVEPRKAVPLFRSLAVGRSAEVCAERYGLRETDAPMYWCIDLNARRLSRTIQLPSDIHRSGIPHDDPLVHLRERHAFGVWTGQEGIEVVRKFRLTPSHRK